MIWMKALVLKTSTENKWNKNNRKSLLDTSNAASSLAKTSKFRNKEEDKMDVGDMIIRVNSSRENTEEIKIENLEGSANKLFKQTTKTDSEDSMSDKNSSDDNVFELETPRIGNETEPNVKQKFDFEEMFNQRKRRTSAYQRRDSRIGMLIGKSSKLLM